MFVLGGDAMGYSGRTRIVTFHGIGAPQRELESGEAPFWVTRERFCAILDRIAERADRDRFVITFDDSNASDLAIATPELAERGLAGRFFVLTGRLGQKGSLDADDVRELVARGMLIGSHGIAHRDLTGLEPGDLADELAQSKWLLEQICREAIEAFSIPFGRYNAHVLRAIRRAGYTNAYSSDGGSAKPVQFLRPRRSLRGDMSMADIELVLGGERSVLRRLRRAVRTTMKQLM